MLIKRISLLTSAFNVNSVKMQTFQSPQLLFSYDTGL